MVIVQFDFKLALSFRNQFISQQVFFSDKEWCFDIHIAVVLQIFYIFIYSIKLYFHASESLNYK